MTRDWNTHYASDDIPWDREDPAPALVACVEAGRLPRGRALDVGCGTGSNARFLAEAGYEVVGVDLSPLAVERAAAKVPGATFQEFDVLSDDALPGSFDLVFDRGCFHVFDDPADRARFAERVAGWLTPEGRWLSLIGSTEGAPREYGPPRRSVRDVADAVEPSLAIEELRAATFNADASGEPRAWILIAGRRHEPAQPSTGQ